MGCPQTGNAIQGAVRFLPYPHESDETEPRVAPQRPDFTDHRLRPFVAPHNEGVECQLPLVHPFDRPGGQRQAQGENGGHLGSKKDQQALVILGVGADLVV